jgi:hypothetical protein
MLKERIEAFAALGDKLRNLDAGALQEWCQLAKSENNWFTEDNVKTALQALTTWLTAEKLTAWTKNYTIKDKTPRKIGVVMAGNIPLVGFHDMLCVLISGHILHAKLSSQDTFLMKQIRRLLIEIDPYYNDHFVVADKLNGMDAVIATGSDNTARYFNYYFAGIPHIIRSNRSSVAVLSGEESEEELALLGKDILQYFGLGCRNVSKIFVPAGYSFNKFYESIAHLRSVIDHNKYINNYEYNKSIYLVNRAPHLDNGFLLVTQSDNLVSPISVLYYEEYNSLPELDIKLHKNGDKIQVVLSANGWYNESEQFGTAQCPSLLDYADGVDTMSFVTSIN